MHESRDRRSALARFAAGASAIAVATREMTGVAAAGSDSGSDAGTGAERKRARQVRQVWSGRLLNPVYTPVGTGDTRFYIITARGGGSGTLEDLERDRKVRMTDARLFTYMRRRSRGKYSGMQSLRLQGINWRLLGADFDKRTDTWTLEVRVCDSNPGKRPNAQAGPQAFGDVVTGCNCDCEDFKCYECRNGRGCGEDLCGACGDDQC